MAPTTAGAGFCRVSSFDGCAVSGSSPGETKAGANAPARFLSRPSGWSQDGDDGQLLVSGPSTSVLGDERILRGQHLPDTMSPLQNVLEMTADYAGRICRTAWRKVGDAGQLGIKINHHERGAQHPNAANFARDVTPLEEASP